MGTEGAGGSAPQAISYHLSAESYRPVSLTSVAEVMEQISLSAIPENVQDYQVVRPSQHRFMKSKSCLTNLISFYGKVTHLVDKGGAVDVVYLDFSIVRLCRGIWTD